MSEEYIKFLEDRLTHQEEMTEKAMEMAHKLMGKLKDPKEWKGLTDEEIADCAEKMEASDPTDSFWREFFRGIEAKLKEKNF